MQERKPNVLVFSIDVWNNVSGSDTFDNLLSGYSPKNVANIYFKSGNPTSAVCDKYFYISENSVIKSIFDKNIKTGIEITREKNDNRQIDMANETHIEKSRYSFFSKHRLWLFVYAREFLWKIGRWKTVELDVFIDSFKPDVLFFPIESYLYFSRVIKYVADKYKIPAVGIMWDDNFTYKVHPYNIGYRLHRLFLRRKVKQLSKLCSKIFVINQKMQREFLEELGFDSEVLTKGAKLLPCDFLPPKPLKTVRIVYTGKLNIGRYETVCAVADAIEELNKEKNIFQLDVYSGTTLNEREKIRLEKRGTRFMGSVTQDRIAGIQKEANVLLMAEALKGKHKYSARLSFSTKIVDYLSSGKCVLAVGPKDIAPIEYLRDNDAALIASDKNEIFDALSRIVNDMEVLSQYSKKACELAFKNHDISEIHKRLYSSFYQVSTKTITEKENDSATD